MNWNITFAVGTALAALNFAAPAFADADCGANTGQQATGEPIFVGGIHGNAAPGDFSSSTDSAAAYFSCVNENGGIHGRPIAYQVENDQWNPELAAQAAAKLVSDMPTVALVGNGSFIEMAVNAGTYKEADIMVMASACAISDCYENSNIVSTNQGPLASTLGAVMFAREELGAENVACITTNIPNSGIWTCNAAIEYMENNGGSGSTQPMNPGAPDANSAVLEAMASGADTIILALPAGMALAVLKVAEEQDIRDDYKWIAPTPLYDLALPDQLGEYWSGHIYVNAELAPFQLAGPDALNWIAVMDGYANADDPRDTFSQAGYLSAKFFTQALMAMDPANIDDRAEVSNAIRAISGYESDLLCGPYYVGDADFHQPNHAGRMVKIVDGGYEMVRDCYEYDSAYFDRHIAIEQEMGLR
jgi:branched-chain amino acid transport system substrate-binding protein